MWISKLGILRRIQIPNLTEFIDEGAGVFLPCLLNLNMVGASCQCRSLDLKFNHTTLTINTSKHSEIQSIYQRLDLLRSLQVMCTEIPLLSLSQRCWDNQILNNFWSFHCQTLSILKSLRQSTTRQLFQKLNWARIWASFPIFFISPSVPFILVQANPENLSFTYPHLPLLYNVSFIYIS